MYNLSVYKGLNNKDNLNMVISPSLYTKRMKEILSNMWNSTECAVYEYQTENAMNYMNKFGIEYIPVGLTSYEDIDKVAKSAQGLLIEHNVSSLTELSTHPDIHVYVITLDDLRALFSEYEYIFKMQRALCIHFMLLLKLNEDLTDDEKLLFRSKLEIGKDYITIKSFTN